MRICRLDKKETKPSPAHGTISWRAGPIAELTPGLSVTDPLCPPAPEPLQAQMLSVSVTVLHSSPFPLVSSSLFHPLYFYVLL